MGKAVRESMDHAQSMRRMLRVKTRGHIANKGRLPGLQLGQLQFGSLLASDRRTDGRPYGRTDDMKQETPRAACYSYNGGVLKMIISYTNIRCFIF